MFFNKIIILPNLIFRNGLFINYKSLNCFNFYDFLIKKNINVKNECGGFGKCNTCSFFLVEGYDNISLFKGLNLSCQLKLSNNNIIIYFD